MPFHEKHKSPAPQGTLSVSPDPARLDQVITISGAWFRPNIVLTLSLSLTDGPAGQGGGPSIGGVNTDASGAFTTPASASWLGTITVIAVDEAVIVGSTTFETVA